MDRILQWLVLILVLIFAIACWIYPLIYFYIGIIIVGIFKFLATPVLDFLITPSFIILCFGLLASFIIFKGYRTRQTIYFSAMLTLIGIILILSGSMIQFPYTSLQSFRMDESKDWTSSFWCFSGSWSDWPVYGENGSLRQIPLQSTSIMKFYWLNFNYQENESIFQIDISTSGPLIFKILQWDSFKAEYVTLLNQKMHLGWFEDDINGSWQPYFWTPPCQLKNVFLVFENPSVQDIVFSFKVTEYFLKSIWEKKVTNYYTKLDKNFAYVGVSFIFASILLEVYSYIKKKT